ncbi:cellulase family glycosylhydrolase [Pedobacter metabolipauper]|uniref:Carbohydrate binding protein with CBM6 domain n=1 Tax=Pedobacter metabolipauper TaxID=425513 RepID=A0A4R6SRZ7_9SPHI|nr:cellulase family glycosylhydrolase [Pedobacter metabolipauper]TDQ07004.1 carbohydrate binding protein with CBM6 domain [Pedobacter metabolipauper]
MMRIYQIISLAVICIAFSLSAISPASAQGFLKADGKRIVNEKRENVLLRAMGLGGWMLQEGYMLGIDGHGQQHLIRKRIEELIGKEQTQIFYNKWLANHTTKADVDAMRSWGFNSIRLPMHYNLYTLPIEEEPVAGQNTWLEKGFAMTDSLLSWCKSNGMYLILDLHGAPGGQGNDFNISDRDPAKPSLWDSEANKNKTIALWHKLAEKYANEPWIGGYDIINEPNWGFENRETDQHGLQEKKNEPLRKLMIDITKAIRSVDQKHLVIIEGNGWGNNYNGIFPLWDDNLVLSYHKYWAFNDQGSAQGMLDARDKYNVPVWLGETGENSNVWFTEAIRLFEKNNIGWAWWPLKKLGHNNPLQVRSNPDYDALKEYWNGKGAKPASAKALKGLMKLADDLKIANTIVHRDVIDAMFRQPFSIETKPFTTHSVKDKTVIQAVDYDLGILGQAYFDTDTADYHVSTNKTTIGNRGRIYRNDGVDIQKHAAPLSGYYISDIETGEWLQYTVDLAKPGKYALKFNVASENNKGKLTFLVNGKPVIKDMAIANTGSWDKFETVTLKNINLAAGKHQFRVLAAEGGFNISSIAFEKLP